MNFITKIFYIAGTASIVGLLFMVCLSMYWQFKPYDIETIYDQYALPIIFDPLHPGEVIRWQAHYVVKIDGVPNDYKYTLEPATGQIACDYRILLEGHSTTVKGEVNHVSAMARVPQDFTPCRYHVKIQATFHPNPNRIITVNAQTEDFTVI